jgi:hypothetical protein
MIKLKQIEAVHVPDEEVQALIHEVLDNAHNMRDEDLWQDDHSSIETGDVFIRFERCAGGRDHQSHVCIEVFRTESRVDIPYTFKSQRGTSE